MTNVHLKSLIEKYNQHLKKIFSLQSGIAVITLWPGYFIELLQTMATNQDIGNRFVRAMQENQDFVLHIATVRVYLTILRLNMPEVYAPYLQNLERCLDQIFDLIPDRDRSEE